MNKKILVLDVGIGVQVGIVLIFGALAGLQYICKKAGSILIGRRVS